MTGAPSIADATTTQSYYWLAGIDVMAPEKAALIVAFGDSITDGARSSNESNHSLARAAGRAARGEEGHGARSASRIMGIGGNRVLRGRLRRERARAARPRRDQPVGREVADAARRHQRHRAGGRATPAEATTAEELIAAYKQIIERAHTHGIKVIGCTLTPYGGAGYQRETGEAVRVRCQRLHPDRKGVRRCGGLRGGDARCAESEEAPRRSSIPATTCTPTTPAIRPWRTPSISGIFTGKRAGK